MKLYAISGLGVDDRLFKYLQLDLELIPLKWVEPKPQEPIKEYALRLSKAIDTKEDFGLLGVSFGGLIATEISQLLNPKFTVLISSAETKDELRPIYRLVGKLNLVNLFPEAFFKIPKFPAPYLFGTKNKTLLYPILDDTDPYFAKWAIQALVSWENTTRINPVLKISGKKDKLLPAHNHKNTTILPHKGHFIIVDQAKVISKKINAFSALTQ